MIDHGYAQWFSAYVDGMLDAEPRARLEAHLRACGECATAVASLRRLVASMRELGDVEPPGDFAARVRERIAAKPGRGSQLASWSWTPMHGLALAATVLLVVGVAVPVYLERNRPREAMPPPAFAARRAAAPSTPQYEPSYAKQDVTVETAGEDRQMSEEESIVEKSARAAVGGSVDLLAHAPRERAATRLDREWVSNKDAVRMARSTMIQMASNEPLEGELRKSAGLLPMLPSSLAKTMVQSDHLPTLHRTSPLDMQAPAPIEWLVPDRDAAAAWLKGWVMSVEGAVVDFDGDRVTITLPRAASTAFLAELRRQGSLSSGPALAPAVPAQSSSATYPAEPSKARELIAIQFVLVSNSP